jgi:hypothetical protein
LHGDCNKNVHQVQCPSIFMIHWRNISTLKPWFLPFSVLEILSVHSQSKLP